MAPGLGCEIAAYMPTYKPNRKFCERLGARKLSPLLEASRIFGVSCCNGGR